MHLIARSLDRVSRAAARRRICAAAAALLAMATLAAQSREPVLVMSFNIRYGTAKDGENEWSARKAMLFDLVREQKADLVGLQEALDFQIGEIVAAAPGYGVVGVGRDDGLRKGEYSAILFRADRFHVADSGTFWFSDTPEVPGSKSWGNNITRLCTWARFVDRDGRGFYHFNVHLDHESQPSRERSALLLRLRIAARAVVTEPVVVTGDFNVGETNPALATLVKRAPHGDRKGGDRHGSESRAGRAAGRQLPRPAPGPAGGRHLQRLGQDPPRQDRLRPGAARRRGARRRDPEDEP